MQKITQKASAWRLTALAGAFAIMNGGQALALTAGNPSALVVTLYKTELYNGSTWETVMSNPAGVQVDLVGNAGTAFGSGSVDAGSYNMVRFTVENQISYDHATIAGGGTDNCLAATGNSFFIDSAPTAPSQVPLTFSTSGGIGWRANGTDAFPYLMTQPIIVGANATTNVKLAFKTANIVQCNGTAVTVAPPSFDVISVLKPASAAFAGGDYWIIGLSKNTTNRLYDGATQIDPVMFTPPGAPRPCRCTTIC